MLAKNNKHDTEQSPEDTSLIQMSEHANQSSKNKGKDELEDVLMQQKDEGDMGAVDDLMKQYDSKEKNEK